MGKVQKKESLHEKKIHNNDHSQWWWLTVLKAFHNYLVLYLKQSCNGGFIISPILSLWASKHNTDSFLVGQAYILFSLGNRLHTPCSASKNDHHALCRSGFYLTNSIKHLWDGWAPDTGFCSKLRWTHDSPEECCKSVIHVQAFDLKVALLLRNLDISAHCCIMWG